MKYKKIRMNIYLDRPTMRKIILKELTAGSKTFAELQQATVKYGNHKYSLEFSDTLSSMIKDNLIKKLHPKRRIYALSDAYWDDITKKL